MRRTDQSRAVGVEGAVGRWRRAAAPGAVGFVVVIAVFALHMRDPHVEGSWGRCPTKLVTGLPCPLCGGLRAVNDMTNGDLGAALHSNALVVAALPLLVVWWVVDIRRRWAGRPVDWTRVVTARGAMLAFVVVLLTFMVVRNLPMCGFLRP